jgi:peptidoglycan/xylan/chitin deacetylase (PgdA/CDA1 family)
MGSRTDPSTIQSYHPGRDGGCAVTIGYDVDMPAAANGLDYLYDREIPWLSGETTDATSHLNDDVWAYVDRLCATAEEYGAKLQFFLQGNAFERPFEGWVNIAERGHALDSHMYQHINLLDEPVETVERQARDTKRLLEEKLNTVNLGVRGPGGYHSGLDGREDVQQALLRAGIKWVSSKYLYSGEVSAEAEPATISGIADCQPYWYETGLLEIPFCCYQDRHFFDSDMGGDPSRSVAEWIDYLKRAVDYAYDRNFFLNLTVHPSTSFKHDPKGHYLREVLAYCRTKPDVVVATYRDVYRWLTADLRDATLQ